MVRAEPEVGLLHHQDSWHRKAGESLRFRGNSESEKRVTGLRDLTMFALICDRLASADSLIPTPTLTTMVGVSSLLDRIMNGIVEELDEIDEALLHAWTTRKSSDLNQRQRDIVDRFINDLLDSRLELM